MISVSRKIVHRRRHKNGEIAAKGGATIVMDIDYGSQLVRAGLSVTNKLDCYSRKQGVKLASDRIAARRGVIPVNILVSKGEYDVKTGIRSPAIYKSVEEGLEGMYFELTLDPIALEDIRFSVLIELVENEFYKRFPSLLKNT